MKMSETRRIAAPPAEVWAALLDADTLQACIPGCESLTGTPETGFEAVVVQKVGPVKATFRGAVALSDIVPGTSCRISGEGKGGAAGFAKGGASVQLAPDGDGTLLSYEVEATVGGKLAQLGSRLIDSFAAKLADQFFDRFQARIEGGADAPDTAPVPPPDGGGTGKTGWFGRRAAG